MNNDLVIGIDSSTTGTKAIAWSRFGEAVAEGRCPISMSNPRPGHFEQASSDWWTSAVEAIQSVLGKVSPERIVALCVTNQRETFVPIDAQRSPLRPAMLWLDERSREEIKEISRDLGAEKINAITGRYPDLTPSVYRFEWMRRHEPDLFSKIATIQDVHGFLVEKLTGQNLTSEACADAFGSFDICKRTWSEILLKRTGLTSSQFSKTVPPGSIIGHLTETASKSTGLRQETLVVAGGGDGQTSALGANITRPGHAYLNLGTAVVSGVYSDEYKIGLAFRTLIAVSGQGFLLESVIRTGTYLLNWFLRGIAKNQDKEALDGLNRAAAKLRPGSEGLLLVPYLSGTMTPYWNPQARGIMFGLSSTHEQTHFYRAILEGLGLEIRLMTEETEHAAGQGISEFIVFGGGSQSGFWCQTIADIVGKPARQLSTGECSSLGAAILAAVGAGWFPNTSEAAAQMGHIGKILTPNLEHQNFYSDLFGVYKELYPRLKDLFERLHTVINSAPSTA
jgi:sugar (pentulose or hexulose) kinase